MPGMDSFIEKMESLFAKLSARRRLSDDGICTVVKEAFEFARKWEDGLLEGAGNSWRVTVPIPLPPFALEMLSKIVLKLDIKTGGKNNWTEFWRKYNKRLPYKFKDLLSLMDVTTDVIVGCHEGEFRIRLAVGPFFEFNLQFPFEKIRPWQPTKHAALNLNTAGMENFNTKIRELAAYDFEAFKCKLEFIDATYAIVQYRTALNFEPDDDDYPSVVPLDVRSLFYLDDWVDAELLRMNDVYGDKYFLRVLEPDYKRLQKDVENALAEAINVRGIYQSYWSKLSAEQLSKFPEKNSRYIWRTKVDTDCAGPSRETKKEKEKITVSFTEYDNDLKGGSTDISVVHHTLSGGIEESKKNKFKVPIKWIHKNLTDLALDDFGADMVTFGKKILSYRSKAKKLTSTKKSSVLELLKASQGASREEVSIAESVGLGVSSKYGYFHVNINYENNLTALAEDETFQECSEHFCIGVSKHIFTANEENINPES
jgi:hypothetical protein